MGITRYASQYGPWEFVYKTIDYLDGMSSSQKENIYDKCDGFIVRGKANLDKITKYNKPIIYSGIIQESTNEHATIVTNSKAIANTAAEYFTGLGLNNYAFCGFKNIEWSKLRKENFVNALSKMNLNCKEYQLPANITSTGSRNRLTKWLMKLDKPCGIFACNDDCARHIIEIAKLADLQIPEDLLIMGVDNDQLICSLTQPQITSIELNFEKCGYTAAQYLNEMINSDHQSNSIITVDPVRIHERQSTDITKMNDQDVAAALAYIKQNFKKAIQVTDIANETSISRRTLEKKFKKHLGRSIHSELKRLRCNHIANLLLETNLTISEICAQISFSSPEHIARQFKSLKGMSPIEFRKKNAKNLTESG